MWKCVFILYPLWIQKCATHVQLSLAMWIICPTINLSNRCHGHHIVAATKQTPNDDLTQTIAYAMSALIQNCECDFPEIHDDVIKWKHLPRNWPFVRGIHRSPVNSPHKDQWRGALMFPLIFAWIYGCTNNREAGDLRRHRAHYDDNVMTYV